MKNKQPKKAALYCRLSVDDGRMGESVSIGSQKLLLEQYCKDHAIDNYEVYDDDGYSGTNFDRPAFQRMYEDIQNGLIDTVLVKGDDIVEHLNGVIFLTNSADMQSKSAAVCTECA